MPIPESQFDTWSHQGSVTQSAATYNAIKSVLEASTTPYADKNYSVFLQGSYGNDTNIYAESDVDIVIKLDDCWQSDLSELTQEEKVNYDKAYVSATYTQNTPVISKAPPPCIIRIFIPGASVPLRTRM